MYEYIHVGGACIVIDSTPIYSQGLDSTPMYSQGLDSTPEYSRGLYIIIDSI